MSVRLHSSQLAAKRTKKNARTLQLLIGIFRMQQEDGDEQINAMVRHTYTYKIYIYLSACACIGHKKNVRITDNRTPFTLFSYRDTPRAQAPSL